jgi:integrase
MRDKLTKRTVDAVAPGEKDVLVWDSQVAGFGLKVTPTGKRTYLVQYRMGGRGSPTRRYTIGAHGIFTVDQARDEARRLLAQVRQGVDPMEAKQAVRAPKPKVITVAEAIERFRINHVSRQRTEAEVMRLLRKDVLPTWGDRPIAAVTKRDVIELLDGVEARGAKYVRNRLHAHLSKLFNWAIGKDIATTSPMVGIGSLPEKSRDRVLEEHEIRRIWLACGQVGEPYGSLVRMLMLTGQRRDEVSGMTRGELSLDKALWTIPRERCKNDATHDVPLSKASIAVMERVPQLGEFVFSMTGDKPFKGFGHAKERLDALSGVTDWRLHDIRRTTATEMAKMGVAQHVVEKILNHQSGVIRGVAAIYNRHSYLDERRQALEAWARRLDTIVNGMTPNVVELTLRA